MAEKSIKIIMDEDEYLLLLEHKKQNEKTRNTWQDAYIKWRNKEITRLEKEYNDKKQEFINEINKCLIDKTHCIVFLTKMKDEREFTKVIDDNNISLTKNIFRETYYIIPNNKKEVWSLLKSLKKLLKR